MLPLTMVCVGRMKAGADRDLAERYVARGRLAGRALGVAIDVREIAESKVRRPADRKAEEAAAIRAAVDAPGTMRIVFDELGRTISSEGFAAIIRQALDSGSGPIALIVGGPDGLDPALRDEASHVLALGQMTWPHQIVRIMLAEQVYRAMTILAGHPYHRA